MLISFGFGQEIFAYHKSREKNGENYNELDESVIMNYCIGGTLFRGKVRLVSNNRLVLFIYG